MMLRLSPILALVLLAFTFTPTVRGQIKEPLVEKVKKSIDRGVDYLKKQQKEDGSWEKDLALGTAMAGGQTVMALLALLNSGIGPDDPVVARGLKYLRSLEPKKVYVRALQTMVFAEAGLMKDSVIDKQRIIDNVKWLLDARQYKNKEFIGWYYDLQQTNQEDESNRQYAILGLISGRQGGATIERDVWEKIRDLCLRTQAADGHWNYSSGRNILGPANPELTMTEAGVCNLLIAAMELNLGCDSLPNNKNGRPCGIYPEDPAIRKGLSWISSPKADRFVLDPKGRIFYSLYGIERVGRFSGNRFIGAHDWYREGSEYLVDVQSKQNGSWSAPGQFDQWPVISTSFSLLFLSKGRTPVLMSKVVHTTRGWPRDDDDTDWNNDRNDLRNLTEFARKKMFNNVPLAWQSFDLLRAAKGTPGAGETDESLADVAGELLASPIAYITGHKAPRFTGQEEKILQKFVENGGFILAEACCGDPRFDQGFKDLVKKLWPEGTLEYLGGDHPVWNSHFKMVEPWKRVSKLMGLKEGCKTVLIYSPQDLSCRWESNKLSEPLIREAFELGCNIIHYATGLELPKPRGFKEEITSQRTFPRKRGYFKVGQIRPRGVDEKPAPRAMSNLMEHMNKLAGLDVVLKTEDVPLNGDKIVNFKFLYSHGRGRIGEYDDRDLDSLRFNLENGGLLLADAACGNQPFDQTFREFVRALFPESKYPAAKYPGIKLERIPENDFLFSKDLNADKFGQPEALTSKNIKCRTEKGGPLRNLAPYLEGVKINGRWVIIYSKYDLGCALEKHRSSDCAGYDTDSAFRLASAAVLYMLKLRAE